MVQCSGGAIGMKQDKCPYCNAKIVKYKHILNKPLVLALEKLADHPVGANIADIGLTHNQICNFQKLRYWKLTEKLEKQGCWKVTDWGYRFLAGMPVPKFVTTYRGKLEMASGEMVSVEQVIGRRYLKRTDYALHSEYDEFTDENLEMF